MNFLKITYNSAHLCPLKNLLKSYLRRIC